MITLLCYFRFFWCPVWRLNFSFIGIAIHFCPTSYIQYWCFLKSFHPCYLASDSSHTSTWICFCLLVKRWGRNVAIVCLIPKFGIIVSFGFTKIFEMFTSTIHKQLKTTVTANDYTNFSNTFISFYVDGCPKWGSLSVEVEPCLKCFHHIHTFESKTHIYSTYKISKIVVFNISNVCVKDFPNWTQMFHTFCALYPINLVCTVPKETSQKCFDQQKIYWHSVYKVKVSILKVTRPNDFLGKWKSFYLKNLWIYWKSTHCKSNKNCELCLTLVDPKGCTTITKQYFSLGFLQC